VRSRIAIFCDGDFWHGHHWSERKKKLVRGANARYWISKIEGNIRRDMRNDGRLTRLGWKVVRWESDIVADVDRVARQVIGIARDPRRISLSHAAEGLCRFRDAEGGAPHTLRIERGLV
jgi:G:T-mismatch repair DNA endonuclease (very short patch repair protein)